jgi:hypothetical protein
MKDFFCVFINHEKQNIKRFLKILKLLLCVDDASFKTESKLEYEFFKNHCSHSYLILILFLDSKSILFIS